MNSEDDIYLHGRAAVHADKRVSWMEMPSMNKTNNSGVILETRGIIKDFPGQRALDNVDFDVRKGEVHALIGENGRVNRPLSRS